MVQARITKSSLWRPQGLVFATNFVVFGKGIFHTNESVPLRNHYRPTAIGSPSVTSNLRKSHGTRDSLWQFVLCAGCLVLSPSILIASKHQDH